MYRRSFLRKTGAGISAVGISSVAGCLDSDTVELTYGHATEPDSSVGRIAQWVTDYVNEHADGVEITHHPRGELGDILEMMENVVDGSQGMIQAAASLAAAHHAPFTVFDAPYLYEDHEDMFQKTDPTESDAAERLIEEGAEASNIRILGAGTQGEWHLTISDDPVFEPGDLSGKAIRAPPIGVLSEAVVGLGAEPVSTTFEELPSAMAAGSVDGQVNSYSLTWTTGVWEHQDYVVETGHQNLPATAMINEGIWNDLNDDQQAIFYEAIDDAQNRSLDAIEDDESEIKQGMEAEGLEILTQDDIEIDRFVESVRTRIRSEFPGLVDDIEAVMGGTYE